MDMDMDTDIIIAEPQNVEQHSKPSIEMILDGEVLLSVK